MAWAEVQFNTQIPEKTQRFKKEVNKMKGYIFHYYKYGDINKEGHSETSLRECEGNKSGTGNGSDEPDQQGEDELNYITFGDYDRVTISQIDAFSRFRDLPKHANSWKGKRRSILLYEIGDDKECPQRIQDRSTEGFDIFGFRLTRNPGRKVLFLGLTILSSSAKDKYDDVKTLRRQILQFLDTECKELRFQLSYEVLGTLGYSDMAIVWFTNQYTYIFTLLDRIKEMVEDVALKYTIISKNHFTQEEYSANEGEIEKIDGKAILYFSGKGDLNDQKLKGFLTKLFGPGNCPSIFPCMGEYDYYICVETKKIYQVFDSGYISNGRAGLNWNDTFYCDYIRRTRVELCGVDAQGKHGNNDNNGDDGNDGTGKTEEAVANAHDPAHGGINPPADVICCKYDKTEPCKMCAGNLRKCTPEYISKQHEKLREQFKKIFPHTAGMIDTLDHLHSDYDSNYAYNDSRWTSNFSLQISQIMEYLQRVCRAFDSTETQSGSVQQTDTMLDAEAYLAMVRDLMNILNRQISHLSHSGNGYLQIPSCHLHYIGQQDMVLYAYFGIIKEIIDFMYKIKRNGFQPKFVPFLTIDVVPTIETRLYADISNHAENRILNINLPSVALFALPTYIPYTVHEIFHYSSPKDRSYRNRLYILTFLTEMLLTITLPIVDYLAFNVKPNPGVSDGKANVNLQDYEAFVSKKNWNTAEKERRERIERILRPYCFRYCVEIIDEIYNLLEEHFKNKHGFHLLDHLMMELLAIFESSPYNELVELTEMADDPRAKRAREISNILDKFFTTTQFENCRAKIEQEMPEHSTNQTEICDFLQRAYHATLRVCILRHSVDDVYVNFICAYREVGADIGMVGLCKMDLVEYLFKYVRTKKDLLHRPVNETQPEEIPTKEVIRMGILVDHLLTKEETGEGKLKLLSEHEEDFVLTYITYYLTIRELEQTQGIEEFKRLQGEAELWFAYIKEAYTKYISQYSYYAFTPFKKQKIAEGESTYLFEQVVGQYDFCDGMTTDIKNLREEFYKGCHLGCFQEIFVECRKEVCRFYQAVKDGIWQETEYRSLAEANRQYISEVFALNVKIILSFQRQKKLCDLLGEQLEPDQEQKRPETKITDVFLKPGKGMNPEIPKILYQYCFRAVSKEALINYVTFYAKLLRDRGRDGDTSCVWYRGEENANWRLLPSLMRDVQLPSLGSALRKNMERFKAVFESRLSLENFQNTDDVGMIVKMQHYRVHTHYLDWSEDAMSSLYFALHDIFEEKPEQSLKKEQTDAAIYLLNPYVFNRVMRRIVQERKYPKASPQVLSIFEKMRKVISDILGNEVPNLSMTDYRERYEAYITGCYEQEQKVQDFAKDTPLDCNMAQNLPFLPLAILTAQNNPRIRAQHGQFIAFNLFAPSLPASEKEPSATRDGDQDRYAGYEYLALQALQDLCIRVCIEQEWDVKECIFMYQIIIVEEIKKEVAEWLRTFGIGEDRVYPELENILRRYFMD